MKINLYGGSWNEVISIARGTTKGQLNIRVDANTQKYLEEQFGVSLENNPQIHFVQIPNLPKLSEWLEYRNYKEPQKYLPNE